MPLEVSSFPDRTPTLFGKFIWKISISLGKWNPFALLLPAAFGLAFFGACLTAYIMFVPGHPYILQTISSIIKLPLIFFLSTIVAATITSLFARITRKSLRGRAIARGSLVALFMTSTFLFVLAPVIAVLSSQGNYSEVILASYAAFLISTLVGALFFYLHTMQLAEGGFLATSLVWCVLFATSTANIGWELRPLVGWTGQPFQLVRTDNGHMWSQVVCEMKNMRFGGIHFPSAGQDSMTKAWPC